MGLLKNLAIAATCLAIGCSEKTPVTDNPSELVEPTKINFAKVETIAQNEEGADLKIDLGKRVSIPFVKVNRSFSFERNMIPEKEGRYEAYLEHPNKQKKIFDGETDPDGYSVKSSIGRYETKFKDLVGDFYMSKTEVTYAQWRRFRPDHQSSPETKQKGWDKPNFPIHDISLEEAVEFCDWLSELSGRKVALPTEHQWNYACTASPELQLTEEQYRWTRIPDNLAKRLMSLFPTGETLPPKYGNFRYIDKDGKIINPQSPKPVKSFSPNEFGIYDMFGNLPEIATSTRRKYGIILKGGSFDEPAFHIGEYVTFVDIRPISKFKIPFATLRLVINSEKQEN